MLKDCKEKEILKRLNAAGYEAYFVGGCVRDEIMGREAHDIDITTSATDIMNSEDLFGDMTELEKKADYFYFYPYCAYFDFYPNNVSEISDCFKTLMENEIEDARFNEEKEAILSAILNDIEVNIGEIDQQYEFVSWLYETNDCYALYEYDSAKGVDRLSTR